MIMIKGKEVKEVKPATAVKAVKARYFRSVIAHPRGAVVHDGDCHVWSCKICTCGLLAALMRIRFPHSEKCYPPYYSEVDLHCQALESLSKR